MVRFGYHFFIQSQPSGSYPGKNTCFLFLGQNDSESNHISEGIVKEVKETDSFSALKRFIPFRDIDESFILRKLAHFSEFMLLTLLFYKYVAEKVFTKGSAAALFIGFCVFVASFDEFHQIFVPGRTPRVEDVFIDSLGGSVGALVGYNFEAIKARLLGFLRRRSTA